MKILFSFILQVLIISSFLMPFLVQAEDKCSSYTQKDSYELYKERLNCICKDYEYNPTIVNLDDNYPKIISAEEMEEKLKPFKEPLDEINKELGRYWSLNGINTARALYSKENIKNTKSYLSDTKIAEEVKKGKKIIASLEKRDAIKKQIADIEKANTTKYSFEDTKEVHRENMNNIYKCGLITAQKKSLLLIKDDLIKSDPTIRKKIEGKITSDIEKLKMISNSIGCTETNDKNSIQKLILLKQATYQTCKYVSYIEYLKEHNKDIRNNLDPKEGNYTPLQIVKTQKDKISELDNEVKQTYKVFPLVFHAYTEYENNITAHFLLELLREDYLALREKLHKALNPINQVVYKIVNAMKK